jgi:hypothetical protein
VSLSLYGEGVLKESLQSHILENRLEKHFERKSIKRTLIKAYHESHFVILPSIVKVGPKLY